MNHWRGGGICACVTVLAAAASARAIVIGTLDTFQDLTTQSWMGALPQNIASGGPAGAGDAFLEATSTGGAGPGSRLAVNNLDPRWNGDYLAAGVTSLELDMVNFGTTPLEMRAVFFSTSGARYTSTTALILPTDGLWHHLAFSLDEASLTRVLGSDTYAQCMSSVARLMFRHDSGSPSSGGTPIATTAGFDNILAVPAPGGALLMLVAGLGAARRRR